MGRQPTNQASFVKIFGSDDKQAAQTSWNGAKAFSLKVYPELAMFSPFSPAFADIPKATASEKMP